MATRTQEACTSDLYDRFYTAMENATAAATTLADNIPDELMGTTGVISAALLAACRSDSAPSAGCDHIAEGRLFHGIGTVEHGQRQ